MAVKAGMPGTGIKVAADVGGTFTDIALLADGVTLASHKVPSTPPDFDVAIVQGILDLLRRLEIDPGRVESVLHGCTVATNAILEGRGARTALVTTAGFRDVLELRRIRVPRLYDPMWRKPPPLVPRNLRFEVRERLGSRGEVVTALDEAQTLAVARSILAEGVQAVAVAYLHSYQNPEHEQRTGKILRSVLGEDCFITLSSDVLPEIREYERTSTAVINAYVGPTVARYIGALKLRLQQAGIPGRLMVMQSSGGMIDADTVMRHPVTIVECGPAAGVIGAQRLSSLCGIGDVITLDMGGTTAKASIVQDGRIHRTDEYEIGGGISISNQLVKGGGYALKTPVIDISEVGAGGGSVIWLDKAGQMKVGPHSAGAVPGPACYGRGGDLPTITDANVVLGYLNPHSIAGGSVTINADRAREVLSRSIAGPLGMSLHEAAYGAHVIANATMTRAVKTVTTYRGRDPRRFTMLAFGGNGGINGVELARAMQIPKVVIPVSAGIFSAVGLLFTDIAVTHSAAFITRLADLDRAAMEKRFGSLEQLLLGRLARPREQVMIERRADLRYVGQAFELTVDVPDMASDELAAMLSEAFEREHETSYGHRFPGAKRIEIVSLRVNASVTGERIELTPGMLAASGPSGARSSRTAYFGPDHGFLRTPVISRADLGGASGEGPLIVEEYDSTVIIPPHARARLDGWGNIEITLDLKDGNP